MTSVMISAGAGQTTGARIGAEHFGANYLFNRVGLQEGTGTGSYDETAASLGVTHVRYPGGTMTERQFDPANPNNDYQATDLTTGAAITNASRHHLTPMAEFLDEAGDRGWDVTIVVPTARYANMLGNAAEQARVEAEIKGFIAEVLSDPNGQTVEIFEIGNEWQAIGLTAAEYGAIANLMAVWIDEAIAEAGVKHPPQIAVQLAPKASRLNETAQILGQMDQDALDATDIVITHNYRPMPWDEAGITEGKFDHVALAEIAAGRPLEVLVSEWNIGNASLADGLLQGAGMLELFHQMVSLGLDRAHIWPILENNTTRLATGQPEEGEAADLTIAGEVFRMMNQSLDGMQAIDIASRRDTDGDGSVDILLNAFGGPGDSAVVFLSSLDAAPRSVTLDLTDMAAQLGGTGALWLTTVDVPPGADPTSHISAPMLHAVSISDLREGVASAPLLLELDPYEIVRLEFAGTTGVQTHADTAEVDDIRFSKGSDVVVMAQDGQRDLIRNFDLSADRLDVSGLGIASLDDLTITELRRADGSVSWLSLETKDGTQEALLRFLGETPLEASRLDASHFILANLAADLPPGTAVAETDGYDGLRGTADAEIFQLLDDGIRDTVRGFDLSADHLDVSAWGVRGFGDLSFSIQYRKDGSANWLNVFDKDGQSEVALRFADGIALDPARLSADHFVFASGTVAGLGAERRKDLDGWTRLDGVKGAEVFQMLDDGSADQIRGFQLGIDKLDVSAFGFSDITDLTLTNQTRRDGSVNWVQVLDSAGETEVKLRFDGVLPDASRLDADDFIF